jgi:FkbM family methyltransferase
MTEKRDSSVTLGLKALARRLYRRLVSVPEVAAVLPSRVSEADIHAAYRLLLGREPDPDGWQTFSALIATADVPDLVGALLSSEEFRRTTMHDALLRREREDLEPVAIGDGLELLISAHDLSNQGLRRHGVYEPHLSRALDEALRPGMSFCAVGANVGYHVVRAAQRVGEAGRVAAFEAHPGNAQLVARNVARNGLRNTVVLPFAVSDERTLLRYVAAQGTNGSVAPLDVDDGNDAERRRPQGDEPGALLVQSIRLDDLLELLSPVDVLQIDVEGCEGRALRGARRLLERDRPTIFSELSLGQLSRISGMTGEDYLGMLRALGYDLAALGFDGAVLTFGDDVDALCAHARAQATAHIDVRCTPR